MVRFADLDDPRFMQFLASPAFATYMIMRRYIWRSTQEHYMGLHEWYKKGFLTCSLERASIARCLGQASERRKNGVSDRKLTYDAEFLERLKVVQTIRTGRQSIYVLGRWGKDADVYYEVFFLDALGVNTNNVDNFPSLYAKVCPQDEQIIAGHERKDLPPIIEKKIEK